MRSVVVGVVAVAAGVGLGFALESGEDVERLVVRTRTVPAVTPTPPGTPSPWDVNAAPRFGAGFLAPSVHVDRRSFSLRLGQRGTRLRVVRDDGTVERDESLDRAGSWLAPGLRVGPRGSVLAVWLPCPARGCTRTRYAPLTFMVRPPGGTFGQAVMVRPPAGPVLAVTAGIGADGTVVVAYEAASAVYAFVRGPGGEMTEPQLIGDSAGSTAMSAEIASNGRIVIAWVSSVPDDETGPVPAEARAAIREPGETRFHAQTLHVDRRYEGSDDPPTGLGQALAVAADGGAIFAWSTVEGLRVATAAPGRRFAAVLRVTREPYSHDVAIASAGRAVLAWVTPTGRVFARVRRSAASAFAQRETLPTRYEPNPKITASIDRSGRPRLRWDGGGTRTARRRAPK